MSLVQVLKNRAKRLQSARSFFAARGVLEVDPGALVKRAPIDANIDVIPALLSSTTTAFLHTSPEYAMKRLLSKGSGDIYFLGHVFRREELGSLHNLEFTMAEWYRVGFSFEEMIQETKEFLSLFLGDLPLSTLSYREAFQRFAGVDYTKDSLDSLIPENGLQWSRKEKTHYILAHLIEPKLGQNELLALTDYPPDEAALAITKCKEGEVTAQRFEIYFQGIELANGYEELSDPQELTRRFSLENEARVLRGQDPYLLDEELLAALENNFPKCCGVSVGFDRAFMIEQKKNTIHDIIVSR